MGTMQTISLELDQIRCEELSRIQLADSTAALEEIRQSVFGKKSRLSNLMRGLGALSAEERPQVGKVANEIKEALSAALAERAEELRQGEVDCAVRQEALDVSLPGIRPPAGTHHPVSLILREIEDIFISMGFSIELGPEIEDDYHNFEALNFPFDHPARDMHDTFYLASDLLLRTHTSPVQIHTMKSHKPPMAVIAPGKCYRCDADVTHSPMFHQMEGFVVGPNIRFSDLKGTLETFLRQMFGPDIPCRFRPHFFPFTEPSAEVDIFFERRHPNGHMVREPLEVLGSGMIHPNVLKNCGIDPEKYSGFAFGMGVERLAMLKYGINAITHFYDNDVRFLRQFL